MTNEKAQRKQVEREFELYREHLEENGGVMKEDRSNVVHYISQRFGIIEYIGDLIERERIPKRFNGTRIIRAGEKGTLNKHDDLCDESHLFFVRGKSQGYFDRISEQEGGIYTRFFSSDEGIKELIEELKDYYGVEENLVIQERYQISNHLNRMRYYPFWFDLIDEELYMG